MSEPVLVDSHCHLGPKHFREGSDEVLARARSAGVKGFLCVGVGANLDAARFAVALAEQHSDVVAAVGVHPHEASMCTPELVHGIVQIAASKRVVAIGEIGLDYHYDFSPRDIQREVFREWIATARNLRKPIVVHTREAADETLEILHEQGAADVGGVFHCFSEDVAFARKALDLGFDISFSGMITFPKTSDLLEVARFIPSDRYYVETDSPYLAPVPYRGKKCEPAYVVHTARKLAELRGTTFDEVARQTTDNVSRRFGVTCWVETG